ncbi:TPA: hypothetical protein U1D13_000617 [Streptococcus suis]|nr:hypothetical protein [Streptococcus suis]HEM3657620.1 hypothetical protein [Streptococcus suis]HEM3699835.1 hypothetical protein [Streptococcus suis]HEM3714601.1 hypothetical protein [Streptococcus suis]
MDKLKGVDIFSLRAYIEPTGGFDTGVWTILTDIFVNFLFAILNVIVLVFSTIINILESFSIYDLYKKIVYDASLELWKELVGSDEGKLVQGSVVFVLLSVVAVYLFIIWLLGRHNFSKKVLHVFVVIALGFGYFGTIEGTGGGLFILDGIRDLSNEALKVVDTISLEFSVGEEQTETLDTTFDFSDSYIAQTSYQTYLYVNTGRIDGKFFNKETEQEEVLDNKKILGWSDTDGTFHPASNSDRETEIDRLGHGAEDNTEKNRWVSAVGDYLFMKMFYVVGSIGKAILLPIPYIVIHLLRLVAELLVLVVILGFPFFLLASFVPQLENVLIGAIKLLLTSAVFPSIGSFMILSVAMINKVIDLGLRGQFQESTSTMLLASNFVSPFVQYFVYIIIWKFKEPILYFFTGGNRLLTSEVNAAAEIGKLGTDKLVENGKFYMNTLKYRYFSPEDGSYDVEMPDTRPLSELPYRDIFYREAPEDVPIDIESPAIDDIPVDVETPAIDDILVDVETPAIDDIPVDIDTLAIDDIPVDVETSAMDNVSVDVNTSAMDDVLVDVESPVIDDILVDVDTPAVDDISVDVDIPDGNVE